MKVTFKHSEIQAAIAAHAKDLTNLDYKPESCAIEMDEGYSSSGVRGYKATIELAEAPKEEATT